MFIFLFSFVYITLYLAYRRVCEDPIHSNIGPFKHDISHVLCILQAYIQQKTSYISRANTTLLSPHNGIKISYLVIIIEVNYISTRFPTQLLKELYTYASVCMNPEPTTNDSFLRTWSKTESRTTGRLSRSVCTALACSDRSGGHYKHQTRGTEQFILLNLKHTWNELYIDSIGFD